MKLLFHSNSPLAPTGYGQQCALFAPRFAEHYETAISSFYGLEGSRIHWKGIPIFPGLGGDFGNEYLADHAKSWFDGDLKGGILLALMDAWVMNPQMMGSMNTVCWAPVDHDPATPATLKFFEESGAIPLAMSRHGEEQLKAFDPIYVPHGVDTDVYKPWNRDEVRKSTGVPEDAFLVGMVAANKGRPSRKGFQYAFEAFRELRERHDNAYLYLHTGMNPNWAAGEDLPALLVTLGIPEECVLVADQYRMFFHPYPQDTMARIYSSMDVLLNPSSGEGFGVPVMEAAACGVPSVVSDITAMPEVAGPGWKVGGHSIWTGQNSWQMVPHVSEIVDALEDCYRLSAKDRRGLSRKCRKHALNYSADKVFGEHFLPAMKEVERRVAPKKPGVLVAR